MTGGIQADFVKRFGAGTEIRIENLSMSCGAGVTVLFGPSGSGKTTLLRCLGGLERPDEGSIHLGDETWFDSARRIFLAPRLRQVGFVPQDYGLFPHMTVEGNIGYGINSMPGPERRNRIGELAQWLGLSDLMRRLPGQLSGGQQQRVALARAVAPRPRLLLLDEPLSALDVPTRTRLRGELRRLLTTLNVPTILVTHDRMEALALGDDMAVLDCGRLVQQGPVSEVFGRPTSVSVAGILAFETVQRGKILGIADGLATISVGGQTLVSVAPELPRDCEEVYACIRAEDVILISGQEMPSSARNHLTGIIQNILLEGPLARIEIDCGFPLAALLTKQSQQELKLTPDAHVTALVKAQNIHLIPRLGAIKPELRS